MASQIVKVYYNDEIRRFRFELGDETHFGFKRMLVKIHHLFPNLDMNRIRVMWKDNDGESVLMSSNSELKEAVRSLPTGENQVLRIHLLEGEKIDQAQEESIKERSIDSDQSEKKDEPVQPPADPTLHRWVRCDGCDSGIRGIRYKCLTCPDYDLCSTCIDSKGHDDHPMIRIASPKDKTWKPAFIAAQGPGPFPFPHFFRGGHHGHHHGRHGPPGPPGPHGPPGHPHHGPHGHRHGPPGPHGPFPFAFGGYNGPRFGSERCHGRRHCQKWAQKQEEENQTIDQSMDERPKENEEAQSLVNEEIIRDLSETISTVLEAFGIATPPQVDQCKNTTESVPTSDTTTTVPTVQHSDQKIAAALNYMLAMGYTNEGGWLTKLLEEKRGDVSAVLDILHPNQSR